MSWMKTTLGEASTFISRGISPKYLENGGIRVLNQKCIRNHEINYDLARRHNIELKKFSEDRYIKLGDVLINSTGQGTLGRVAQVKKEPKEPTTVDSHITIVRPKNDLFYLEYFGYAAIAIEKTIEEAGQGASGQTELAKSKVQNELEISYPQSLTEQQRIVAKLDIAFDEIDSLFELYIYKDQLLKDFKAKFLGDFFNTRTFSWIKLEDLFDLSVGGTPSKSNNDFWHGDIPWYTSREINHKYTNDSDDCISKNGLDKSSAKIFPKGSLLMGMNDTAAMKMSILNQEGTFNQNITGLKPSEGIEVEYVYYALTYLKKSILEMRRGVRQQYLSLKKIKEIKIPLCDMKLQKEFINRMNLFETNQSLLLKNQIKIIPNIKCLKSAVLSKELQKETA